MKNFSELDRTMQISLLISMGIRNEMEGFHSEHLSDSQMKELNPIIRQAVYNILTYLKLANPTNNNDENKPAAERILNEHAKQIPEYWELPDQSVPIEELEQVSNSAPFPASYL